MTTRVWIDNRTGPVGRIAGNLVLGRIQQLEGEKISKDRGTVFSTSDKTFVGRVCATDEYLQPGVVHFCNMSPRQTKNVETDKKSVHFIFITISGNIIHYWIVPKKTVEEVLENASPKPSSKTCHLRIMEKDEQFFLGDKNITQYHQTIRIKKSRAFRSAAAQRLSRSTAQRLSRSVAAQIASAKQNGTIGKNGITVATVVNGQKFEGVLTPTKEIAVTA